MSRHTLPAERRWILFFYSVPSKPVNNRMTVWRKLVKAGAIPLKGAVYVLPFSEDHYEFAQWLVAEVKEMQGDAAMLAVDRVDSVADSEVIELFRQARRSDYLPLAKEVEEIARKLNAIRKGGQGAAPKTLAAQLEKSRKAWSDIQRIDFFATEEGAALGSTIASIQQEVEELAGGRGQADPSVPVRRRKAADYQGRTWATRSRPFVDRMATAWLIATFIDPRASFVFIDGGQDAPLPAETVAFDVAGGEFTHVGDLCTFEVMLRAFGLKDKGVRQIAEIVHDLDLKDNKYQSPEAAGVEEILRGIRQTAADDQDALARGMQVFALLHAAKKS